FLVSQTHLSRQNDLRRYAAGRYPWPISVSISCSFIAKRGVC
ncbi:hypothetical protein PanWU01x14_249320, partial [Parasponia andersonii]